MLVQSRRQRMRVESGKRVRVLGMLSLLPGSVLQKLLLLQVWQSIGTRGNRLLEILKLPGREIIDQVLYI